MLPGFFRAAAQQFNQNLSAEAVNAKNQRHILRHERSDSSAADHSAGRHADLEQNRRYFGYPNANAGGTYQEGGGIITDGNVGASTEDVADAGDAAEETGDAADAGDGTDANGGAAAQPGAEPIKYSLYIAYGETAAQIAQKLLDSGLIKDNNEFYDALLAADAATRLQAGSFIITEGATPAEIVNILTGR
jgi:hypothetical protein